MLCAVRESAITGELKVVFCRPDLSPIELCWSKLQATAALSRLNREALISLTRIITECISADDALGWFVHCGLLSYLKTAVRREELPAFGQLLALLTSNGGQSSDVTLTQSDTSEGTWFRPAVTVRSICFAFAKVHLSKQ